MKSTEETDASAKIGGDRPPADGDSHAGGAFSDELDSKLNELFAADYDEADKAGKRRMTKSPVADGRTSKKKKALIPESPEAAKPAVLKSAAPLPQAAIKSESPLDDGGTREEEKALIPEPPDDMKAAGLRSEAPPQPAAGSRSELPLPPAAAKKKVVVSRPTPATSPPALDSEPAKTPIKKQTLMMAALGAIVFCAGMIALFFFLKDDPPIPNSVQPAAVLHKIVKPPAKAPDMKASQPVMASAAKISGGAPLEPEPSPAVPAEKKESLPPAKPPEITPAQPATASIAQLSGGAQPWPESVAQIAGDAQSQPRPDSLPTVPADKKEPLPSAHPPEVKAIQPATDSIAQMSGDARPAPEPPPAVPAEKKEPPSAKPQTAAATGTNASAAAKPQKSASYPYSIHAGSYRSLASARAEIEAYRQTGLEAYWTSVDLGEKGSWYRIFIGWYGSRESAESVVKTKALRDVSIRETRYAHLIGTYISEDKLQNRLRILLKEGYSPYVVADQKGRRKLYVGAYFTLKDAEKSTAEMRAKGISARVVER